ncbi:MAG: 2-oxoglutarate dehydrogenase complex dihydrolipoyllysine-residue succinyltransferase [Gammaproteobacteria bacterium]|nr:2-oxoglutarate dehydrogenase complex dihydrolipoyllysine-residue succinyltransferase [Gammaproteobacteria bacterium]
MLVAVKVPVLAESVPDATLLEWHKKSGERVVRGDNLIDLETDKVTLEIAAPVGGVLVEIRKKTGEVVTTDEILAVIDTGSAGATPDAAPPIGVDAAPPAAAAAAKMGPAARKLLQEQGLDGATIQGSGKDGRVTKGDVLARSVAAAAPPVLPPLEPLPSVLGARADQRVAMTRLRKRTAERLLQAQRQAAILTTFNEVNMQPVMDLRQRYKDEFEKRHGVRMGFMSFFVKAAVEALKKFPVVNASIDGEDIVYHNYFDIGVAVGSERGLVVPILRDAETLTFGDIERGVREFGERARTSKLTIEDLTGGTFTISNGGIFGSLLSTPILNPPQSAILGMHKIQDRPVVEHGSIVIRPMMYLAMSYDHRIIDGREAVQCLDTIRLLLEDPSRMLLQV